MGFIPGGGGNGGAEIISAVKTANEIVNNSNTLQNDDHLFIAVEASSIYSFLFFPIGSAHASADLKFAFSVPSGTTMDFKYGNSSVPRDESHVQVFSTIGVGQKYVNWGHQGYIITAGTPGNVQMQWAQNTPNVSDAVVYKGSYLMAVKTD